jgi:hypothetical protein
MGFSAAPAAPADVQIAQLVLIAEDGAAGPARGTYPRYLR